MNRYSRFTRDILQWVYEKTVYNKVFKKYVLMFHIVSDDKGEWYEEEFSISMREFTFLIKTLQENGYHFATPDEIIKDNSLNSILLSFDDSYECIYYNVYPYLKAKGIPFIVFQTWELLGKNTYLKEYMIRDMMNYCGFTLGGHALTHVRLSDVSKEQSKSLVIESKMNLEKLFSTQISYMAYPYGSYSAVRYIDRQNVKKSGFIGAFGTVNKGIGTKIRDRYFLPRINVNERNLMRIIERCTHSNGN